MLSGKAISWAIQGHIIVDSFLDSMLLSEAFRMPKFLEETETEEVELSNKILSRRLIQSGGQFYQWNLLQLIFE